MTKILTRFFIHFSAMVLLLMVMQGTVAMAEEGATVPGVIPDQSTPNNGEELRQNNTAPDTVEMPQPPPCPFSAENVQTTIRSIYEAGEEINSRPSIMIPDYSMVRISLCLHQRNIIYAGRLYFQSPDHSTKSGNSS